MTDLSIIIVCYKGWTRLTQCLNSLDSFLGNNFNYEVIVVDNKSDDATIYEIEKKYSRFKFIHNPVNGGFANGCNLGAKKSSGNFFLFLNPDTIASEEELGKLLNAARGNPEYSILSCRQLNENGNENIVTGSFPEFYNLTGLQRAIYKNRKSNYSQNTPDPGNQSTKIVFPGWVSGSVILISKTLFTDINGFDEDFWMYFEDVDLCKRVTDNGGMVALLRDVVIEHNHGGSSRINIKTASITKTEVYISQHMYINKHKKGIEKVMIEVFLVINNIVTVGVVGIAGLLLFFIPKVFLRTLILARLIAYYCRALFRSSWISPRSVNCLFASGTNVKKA